MTEAERHQLIEQMIMMQEQQAGAGQMGFDQELYNRAMSDPAAMDAGADLAGLMDDRTAMGLMDNSSNYQVPNGGQLGITDALSKGVDKGLGLYNILNAQKAKANALRTMGGGQMTGAEAGRSQNYEEDMMSPSFQL